MSKHSLQNDFFYVAKSNGNWRVTDSTIQLGREIKGPDLEAIYNELDRELNGDPVELRLDPRFPLPFDF